MLFIAILLLISNVALLSGGVYAYAKARNVVANTQETIFGLATPEIEGQLSPIGQMFDTVSTDMANKIGVTVQAAIRGSMGGTMKGVNAELEQLAIDNNPAAGLAQALPKSLRKNPLAMMGAEILLQKIMSGQSGSRAGNNNNGKQVKFNL